MDEQSEPHFTEDSQPEQPPQSAKDYLNTVEPLQAHKKSGLIKTIVIVAVLLLVVGGGAVAYLKNKDSKKAIQNAPVAEVAEQPKPAINTETKRYSSSQFFLDFDHPSDWEIKDEPGSGLLTATSPNLSIPAAGGGVTTGRVVLTIKSKSQKLPDFDTGNAVAVIDSEKVAYTKPSSAQRGQTYVSFLSYPASASTSLIDGVYITGDFGYKKDQAIPKVDITNIDPIISLAFYACDGTCTKSIGIAPEAWADAGFGGTLKKLLQSFTIN